MTRPVDWSLAERIALRVGGREPLAESYHAASLAPDFAAFTAEAEELVAAETGLRSQHGPARARVLDRPAWIRANLASFERLLRPLLSRIEERIGGGPRPVVRVGAAVAGAEPGTLLGWMSGRVLGQYDLLVVDDESATEQDLVYYVGPNVLALEKRFGFPPGEFRLWIALHEVTHRAQFTGVPWLRPHFLGLVEQAVGSIEPDPERLARALKEAVRGRAGQAFRDGGLLQVFAPPEQREVLARIAGMMSLLEGHGDATMDRAGRDRVPQAERFSRVLRARHEAASAPVRLLQRLTGIEAKLNQYEQGERFLAAIEKVGGRRVVDVCWEGPENLPSLEEIRAPERWLARVGLGDRGGVIGADAGADLRAGLLARCAFPSGPLTSAVSGGADSLALLVLATATGESVTAIHVDHGLRPESAAEAGVVSAAAIRFGAAFRAEKITVAPGPNLEARARQARFAVLPAGTLTGHTLDDQAETVVLNLLRGSGLDGLAAMRTESHPLLGLRRSETHQLCAAVGLEPVDDPSNDDPSFVRNRIRHEVMPLLDEVAGRDVAVVLARQAALVREDTDFLDTMVTLDPSDAKALAGAPPVLARRALRRWLAHPYPPGAAAIERILAVARGTAVACDVEGKRRISRSGQRLYVEE